jgi:hypothetical protein
MASPWNERLLVTGTSCWLPQEGAKTTIGQCFWENTTRLTVGFTNGDTLRCHETGAGTSTNKRWFSIRKLNLHPCLIVIPGISYFPLHPIIFPLLSAKSPWNITLNDPIISFDQWNGTYSPFPSHLPILVVQPAIFMAILMAIQLYGLPLGT